MRNFSRFIPGEEIDAVAQWRFGGMDAASILLQERGKTKDDDAKAEVQRQQGYAEGFVQGRAQAMLEAQREINDFTANQGKDAAREFARLLEAVQAQLNAAEQATAQGVLELACELARQMLRNEISSNPNALLPVVREALGLLFTDSRGVQVKLNPLDLDVLEPVLREEFPNLPLNLRADAAITRGGCLVDSGGTIVDGRLEKRWARAIAQLGQKLPWEEPGDGQ
jgi:flagellar assembly protein FliH